mmetsp:Transcript_21398/g.61928  ORF Transcript_21398/g.61928 Transcript_21398/m.61928 type:complete len:200 (-) Transcript_21398:94-693(-)
MTRRACRRFAAVSRRSPGSSRGSQRTTRAASWARSRPSLSGARRSPQWWAGRPSSRCPASFSSPAGKLLGTAAPAARARRPRRPWPHAPAPQRRCGRASSGPRWRSGRRAGGQPWGCRRPCPPRSGWRPAAGVRHQSARGRDGAGGLRLGSRCGAGDSAQGMQPAAPPSTRPRACCCNPRIAPAPPSGKTGCWLRARVA